MIEQIEYIYSWIDVKLNKHLSQRGAEMVEYAIALAGVAVLGAWFYSNVNPSNNPDDPSKQKTFMNVLARFWNFIDTKLNAL